MVAGGAVREGPPLKCSGWAVLGRPVSAVRAVQRAARAASSFAGPSAIPVLPPPPPPRPLATASSPAAVMGPAPRPGRGLDCAGPGAAKPGDRASLSVSACAGLMKTLSRFVWCLAGFQKGLQGGSREVESASAQV